MAIRIQMRRNVFETNSSSMHSVSYQPKQADRMLDLKAVAKELKNDQGQIVAEFGEFGHGYDVLSSFHEKLSYVVTELGAHFEKLHELEKDQKYQWLKEMIKNKFDAELVAQVNEDDYYPMGYVDHQSQGMLSDENLITYDREEFQMNIFNLLVDEGFTIIISSDG